MELIILETKNIMNETILCYKNEINKIRTGRVNPSILENIYIKYHNNNQNLNNISQIKVVEFNQLLIKPYDSNLIKSITEAIIKADLNLQIKIDSEFIRLIFPKLTEDVRKNLIKLLNKKTEEYKIKIRNCRRDINQKINKLKLSEDQLKKTKKIIQKLTDDKINEILLIENDKKNALIKI